MLKVTLWDRVMQLEVVRGRAKAQVGDQTPEEVLIQRRWCVAGDFVLKTIESVQKLEVVFPALTGSCRCEEAVGGKQGKLPLRPRLLVLRSRTDIGLLLPTFFIHLSGPGRAILPFVMHGGPHCKSIRRFLATHSPSFTRLEDCIVTLES